MPAELDPANLPVAEIVGQQAVPSKNRPDLKSHLEASLPDTASLPTGVPEQNRPAMSPGETPASEVGGLSEAAPATSVLMEPTQGTCLATAPANVTVAETAVRNCPSCGSVLSADSQFCSDCGYALPEGAGGDVPMAAPAWQEAAALPSGTLVANRYEIASEISRRPPTIRYRAVDRQNGQRSVVLVQQAVTATSSDGSSVCIGRFRLPAEISTQWPELGWEIALLEQIHHPAWPRVLDVVQDNHAVFLVEEAAEGPDLWSVFDDPHLSMIQRFELLAQFCEGMKVLVHAGAIPEYLKPELLRQGSAGQLMLTDLSLLVPLPYPAQPHLATTPYTPPELILNPTEVDGQSPLYSFGALLYALYLGHELTESDFERPWIPKSLVFRFPDAHPAYARLIMKTFVREKEHRFPTDEAARSDPTGWDELARALRHTGRQLSIVRLDAAGWSNIGKLRSNNEDAFALWHSTQGFEERLGETFFAVLCDGMGGYEAGEVAAAMAIELIRQRVLQSDYAKPLLTTSNQFSWDAEACRRFLFDMLREVNQQMYQFSRSPQGKRGMGCTCELLIIHGNQAVLAHVGDSRAYHYSDGHLRQLTRDQTLVNRLVELGQLTPEEAEHHPRKNELQQALGAQPFVEPQTLSVVLKPGDWLLVCSDGLTNHVDHATLTEMLQRADSAEMCARRLINLANAYGGSDNTTVITIRCQ
ncbi:MAG: protein phosphatase 2C domain-containing protein [Gemmatales bacterium]|nr:protein phosphatase 2C domain-containing protein [Gemmatales bacterium]MDW8223320.1 protein phosphatase 2C domain-containing protein [Gemmatales bacterium]